MTQLPIKPLVGKLVRVPLREVWEREAHDFTQWLEANLDVLNEALDIEVASASREQAAGVFSVDLVGQTTEGSTVVIENQLEKSDHDHLGKLLTYLASFGAKAAVWITSIPRPEHAAAIQWLNQTQLADFYFVKVEAVRIGNSDPAAIFTLVVGPSPETKAIGQAKEEIEHQKGERLAFWTALMEDAKGKSNLFAHKKLDDMSWMGIGAGKSGISFNFVVWKDKGACVELYIDRFETDEQNRALLSQLRQHQIQVEETFGEPLEWQDLPGKRACRVKYHIPLGGWAVPSAWSSLTTQLNDAMSRFHKALKPYVDKLP